MVARFDEWLEHSESKAAGILRLIGRINNALSSGPNDLGLDALGRSAFAPGFDAGPVSERMAGGGRVPGHGFGDIVRALLTPGEFVHRVAAVHHYGLDFMQRLNNLQIPRFELGGLVSSLQGSTSAPQRFASGGLVEAVAGGGGRAPVHLHLGGEEFVTETDAATAQRLVRFATLQQMKRAGRVPSWGG